LNIVRNLNIVLTRHLLYSTTKFDDSSHSHAGAKVWVSKFKKFKDTRFLPKFLNTRLAFFINHRSSHLYIFIYSKHEIYISQVKICALQWRRVPMLVN
jgi:hypothetical protein